MDTPTLTRRSALAGLTLPLLPAAGRAQSPQALEYVLGYPPGSAADAVGRMVADGIAKALDRTVVVTNKPGAGTTIAAQYVATARVPMLFNADFATLATMPHLLSRIPYDPDKDLAPISMLARVPLMLAVAPSAPARNLSEFVAWSRSTPGGVSYGSSGPGSPHHLAGELVKDLIGANMVHVPYRGGGPLLNDMVGGQIKAGMVDLASAKAFIAAGKIRGIAIASLQRAQALPDVATFHEQGFANFESSAWQAVVASPATPADLRASFHAALHAALANPALKQRLESLGVETLPTTPEQMTSYTRAERARWGEIIRKHNIRID